ncbi:hypothetical protein FRC06_002253 [Ceratobasidium sp. 370]|nr:hypothetical protein FRC06_002253 [Ceratobasidium sp. 370]
MRSTLEKCTDFIEITSHPASPVIHFTLKTQTSSLHPSAAEAAHTAKSNPHQLVLPNQPVFDIPAEEAVLQQIVDECLAQALARKDVEKAAGVLKGVVSKVAGKRR